MGWGPKAPKPDPAIGEAAKANAKIAKGYLELARQEAADQKALTAEFSPLFRQMIQQSVSDAATSRARSDAQWESYSENFAPLEAELAQRARDFDTPERREAAAREASTTVGDEFDQQRVDREQAAFSSGAQPGSGAMLALENASRIEEAKARAGASNDARSKVESQGLALLDNAARFGRNMPSSGIATAALASQQAGQAQGQVGGLQGLASAPYSAQMQGMQGAVGANSAAGNLLLGDYSARMQAYNAGQGGILGGLGVVGDLLGGVAGAAGAAGGFGKLFSFASSETAKDMGDEVDGLAASEAVERSPAQEWSYKPGLGDGSTKPRIGPTAESLHAVAPEVSDGKKVDGIAMLGLHHAAIGGQAKRLKRIEQRLGLSDAPVEDVAFKEVA